MKVGDLVQGWDESKCVGIVVEVINNDEVPPVVKVLWEDGLIYKEWSDELRVVNESR